MCTVCYYRYCTCLLLQAVSTVGWRFGVAFRRVVVLWQYAIDT